MRAMLLLVGLIVSVRPLLSQSINYQYTRLNDGKLELHYDLRDSIEGRAYSVRLYSSKDNYLNALEKVSGDLGMEVKPGESKKIIWDAKTELGETFDGKVAIEIRARLFIPFISLNQINQIKSFKRKREYNLTWSGGKPSNVLNFDLIHKKNGTKVTTFPNLSNVGYHQFEFPAYVKPGSYQFRVTDVKNKDEVVTSHEFRIRRKIPLVAKALALGVFAAGILAIIPDPVADETLPAAPIPSNK